MQLPVHNLSGEVIGQADVHDVVFGIEPNTAVMHQALVRQHANARLGTHNTLTRGNVSGGGKKPWRQKGTGHARQGSIRAPQWRGGGVVFGPHPRSYKQDMPRKMRRLAVRSALSQKVREDRLLLVSGLHAMQGRTKSMQQFLQALNLRPSKALIATNGRADGAERAGRNLEDVRVIHASNLNLADMLKYDYLLLASEALDDLQRTLAEGASRKTTATEQQPQPEPAFVVAPATATQGGAG